MNTNSTNATLRTVIIFTTKMKELSKFYEEGLELSNPFFENEDHIGYKIGENYFGFDSVEKKFDTSYSPVSLWFTVDDLKKTLDKLIKLGGKSNQEPALKPWGSEIASVLDLDGNILGLEQR